MKLNYTETHPALTGPLFPDSAPDNPLTTCPMYLPGSSSSLWAEWAEVSGLETDQPHSEQYLCSPLQWWHNHGSVSVELPLIRCLMETVCCTLRKPDVSGCWSPLPWQALLYWDIAMGARDDLSYNSLLHWRGLGDWKLWITHQTQHWYSVDEAMAIVLTGSMLMWNLLIWELGQQATMLFILHMKN